MKLVQYNVKSNLKHFIDDIFRFRGKSPYTAVCGGTGYPTDLPSVWSRNIIQLHSLKRQVRI